MPGKAPRCNWYNPSGGGRSSSAGCACLPCAPGTWGKGGRLSQAACEPVSPQTLSVSLVLRGTCGAYNAAGDALVTQLAGVMAGYTGVVDQGADIQLVGQTEGRYSGKVRLVEWPDICSHITSYTHHHHVVCTAHMSRPQAQAKSLQHIT
jgi:hypothetical protein